MSPRPKRLPPVRPQQAKGAPEARLMARQRASLRDLQSLAADLGLPPAFAMSWHARRLNLGQAKVDANAMIQRRQRGARVSLRH